MTASWCRQALQGLGVQPGCLYTFSGELPNSWQTDAVYLFQDETTDEVAPCQKPHN